MAPKCVIGDGVVVTAGKDAMFVQVLTHFPPADTYNSQLTADEVLRAVSSNKDVDRAPVSLMLYGNGDGGGGPTRGTLLMPSFPCNLRRPFVATRHVVSLEYTCGC
jgi:alpha-mannosidase